MSAAVARGGEGVGKGCAGSVGFLRGGGGEKSRNIIGKCMFFCLAMRILIRIAKSTAIVTDQSEGINEISVIGPEPASPLHPSADFFITSERIVLT